MTEVFISYKREERELMRPIAEALVEIGVDIWFDGRVEAGASFGREINERLKTCKAQIVCWSPQAVDSDWVCGEAQIGFERGVLVPITIQKCDLGAPFNRRQTIELVGWNGDASHVGWRNVLDQLSQLLGRDVSEHHTYDAVREARARILKQLNVDDEDGAIYWESVAAKLSGVSITVSELTLADALANAARRATEAKRESSTDFPTPDDVFEQFVRDEYGPRSALQVVWTLGLRESPVVNLPFGADDPIGKVAERVLYGARAGIQQALDGEFASKYQVQMPVAFKLRFTNTTKSALATNGDQEDATIAIGRMLSKVPRPKLPQTSNA